MWLLYINSLKVEKEEILFLKHKGIQLPTDYRNKKTKLCISKNNPQLAEKLIRWSNLLISKAEITSYTSMQPEDWDWKAFFRRRLETLGYILCSLWFSFSLSLAFGFLFPTGTWSWGAPSSSARDQPSAGFYLPSPLIWPYLRCPVILLLQRAFPG